MAAIASSSILRVAPLARCSTSAGGALGAETTNDEKTEYKISMTDVEYGPHTFPSLKGKFTSMAQQMG